ncbi:hypothetical protein H0H92_013164, partial [Tricholoma furcatifolium]
MAAATRALRYPSYLAITVPGDASQTRPPAPPILVDDARASIWQIVKDKDDAYVLTTNGKAQRYGKVQRHEAFLTVSEDGMLDSIKKRTSNCPVTTPSERWQITEYWPSIPQDTNPNLNGLAVEALRADYRQQVSQYTHRGNCLLSLTVNDKENDLLLADGPQDRDKNPAASGGLFPSQDENGYVMTSHSQDLSHPGPSFLATESGNYNNKVPYNEHELPTQPNTTFNQLEAVNHFLMNMPWMADPEVSMDV